MPVMTAPTANTRDRVTDTLLTITMLVLALSGWLAYLGLDKDAIVVDAVRIAVPLAIGGIGGYYYGRRRAT